jgi:hypothetical protein
VGEEFRIVGEELRFVGMELRVRTLRLWFMVKSLGFGFRVQY